MKHGIDSRKTATVLRIHSVTVVELFKEFSKENVDFFVIILHIAVCF